MHARTKTCIITTLELLFQKTLLARKMTSRSEKLLCKKMMGGKTQTKCSNLKQKLMILKVKFQNESAEICSPNNESKISECVKNHLNYSSSLQCNAYVLRQSLFRYLIIVGSIPETLDRYQRWHSKNLWEPKIIAGL